MNKDALRAAWTSNQPDHKETLMTTISAVLDEDRAAQEKERWINLGAVVVMGLLFPALLWCAAFGTAPLVRGGYALLAAGTAIILFGAWMHRQWSQQALPGPSDTRSQAQKTAWLLSRQVMHLRSGAVWSAPIFVGAALIGGWVYQERSQLGGCLLLAGSGAAWVLLSVDCFSRAQKLDERRARMTQLLRDLE